MLGLFWLLAKEVASAMLGCDRPEKPRDRESESLPSINIWALVFVLSFLIKVIFSAVIVVSEPLAKIN